MRDNKSKEIIVLGNYMKSNHDAGRIVDIGGWLLQLKKTTER